MPELPEVETTRRGIEPHVRGRTIRLLEVREPRLRWPIPDALPAALPGRRIEAVNRRGKYLLLNAGDGTLIVHLGMSGALRFHPLAPPPGRHDHYDLYFEHGGCLRFTDPRRFGSLHFSTAPLEHPLLASLGPEPLDEAFSADYLAAMCRGRRVAIKAHLMNARVVVGVGNIYANEALFRAGIHPLRAAGRISRARLGALVEAVRDVLSDAIERGGTTLRDFVGGDGQPGYFQLDLDVYGREGEPCRRCAGPVRAVVLGQRATYYCPACQR